MRHADGGGRTLVECFAQVQLLWLRGMAPGNGMMHGGGVYTEMAVAHSPQTNMLLKLVLCSEQPGQACRE